ncbi:5-amino-6-(5-phosphoribosylamino)uracil reductase [Streptacidiphilus sp. PB12-B1b]|uniref:dihydrofolate reductase family protein n=1 Tax=Streptacidiphilus sp. PB12-B1b TaxID=2705012 RepID=UPI0015FB4ECD|nr:dihydrofolate reductase family protein [Streptacidiphilus sp. PB12-B1b]QMU75488.1 5-amino-6-(5-phosphoribosylamino)uracil reductase [Streptacidiphilus sp. PB12-B1b]
MSQRRPYVLLSVAMSVDGYIDDAGPERLVLSGAEDFERVDRLRAGCDAILVGAGTLRVDDPRLLVYAPGLRAERLALGLPANPLRVVLTGSGELDPGLRLWHQGDDRLVYAPDAALPRLKPLAGLAEIVGTGAGLDFGAVLDDLGARGVRRLMVEGGSAVHTLVLTSGLADEIQLAVAPFFVGDPAAPRFVGPGRFPQDALHRMQLAGTATAGDVAVLRYVVPRPADPQRLDEDDRRRLRLAVELSRQCPPSATAYSVGAVVVAADGTELARGYSRETGPAVHAEQAALAKLDPADPRLRAATLYTTLEPCSTRASAPVPCARLVLAAGIPRVVLAWREPSLFVADCQGVELLEQAGVTVLECPELAAEARAVNAHLVRPGGVQPC